MEDTAADAVAIGRGSNNDHALDELLEAQLRALQAAGRIGIAGGQLHATSPSPWYQRGARAVVLHRDFELVIVVLTILNCIALALYSPLEPPTHINNVLMNQTGMLAFHKLGKSFASPFHCTSCDLPSLALNIGSA
jgi:quinol-cytochrome oxidoreductase complex cytochrome b subunit